VPFWKVSGNYFLALLLASHVACALAASVSHHDVVSAQRSQLFLHSLLGTCLVFNVEKQSRFQQLLHPSDPKGQDATALHNK